MKYQTAFIKAAKLPKLESAGGLVCNTKGEVLFILKNDQWDLPKGRIEKGDDYERTAIREVVEETGVREDKLRIVTPLCPTWHLTRTYGREYLKKTSWYLMRYDGKGKRLSPQISEGITECRWIHPDDFDDYRPQMRLRIDYLTNLWKRVFYDEEGK